MRKIVVLALVSSTFVTACGGSAQVARTPLEVSQVLAEKNIPCESQSLDRIPSGLEDLGETGITLNRPDYSLLSCTATGGTFQIVVVTEADDLNLLLRVQCAQQVVSQVISQTEIDDTDFVRGATWIGQSTPTSIVTNEDLADALAGEIVTSADVCQPFSTDLEEIRATAEDWYEQEERARLEQARLDALSGDPQKQQELARDETAPPGVLLELVGVADDEALCRLAANPASTPEVIEAIITRTQGFFDGDQLRVQFCVANSELTPDNVLELLARSRYAEVSRAALRNLNP